MVRNRNLCHYLKKKKLYLTLAKHHFENILNFSAFYYPLKPECTSVQYSLDQLDQWMKTETITTSDFRYY